MESALPLQEQIIYDRRTTDLTVVIMARGAMGFAPLVPMLLSTLPLHKLMAKGDADMRAKKELNIEVGARIKQARENAGLTQERFAELVSLATKNVSDIERGVVGVSLGSLKRICETLSISSDSILFGVSGDRGANDPARLVERLGNLPDAQYELAVDMVNKLLEAFAVSGK